MKTDLRDRSDIERLLATFYTQIRADSSIGYIFDEVAKVDWDHHLPLLCDFWESVLFGKAQYKGNPMLVHILLNRKTPLNGSHFTTWLHWWTQTIDTLFAGEKAEEAKARARNIAQLMQFKIETA